MSDKYFLLDHIWLLPVVLGAVFGGFIVALKAADIFRSVPTRGYV